MKSNNDKVMINQAVESSIHVINFIGKLFASKYELV